MGAVASRPSLTGSPRQRLIRLMIVDDSMVARAVLGRMIDADGGFEIAAVAGTAEDAIDALAHVEVDVVLLDLEMPGVGGLRSIPRILDAARGAKVLIVSSLAEDGAEETIAALALGAADTLPKPGTGRFQGRFSEVLVAKLRALGHAARGDALAGPVKLFHQPPSADALQLLAIGASTGGIHALGSLFAALPERIGVPILVTQHLPPAFMSVFSRQLAVAARREAYVGEEGMCLLPDRIVVAPGDAHLVVDDHNGQLVVRLLNSRASSGCLPSLDPMFASASDVLGAGALGIVLTGMGRDGLEGARRLVARGGTIVAQDEASSAVWGMPRAVTEAGLASAVLPPDQIAYWIAERAKAVACR